MTHDDTLELYVALGIPGHDSLTLRMTPEIADEVLALLDEHGLAHRLAMEFSAAPDLAAEAVRALGAAGGLAALASVINTMIKRHDTKRFVLERGGEKIEVAGYSEKAVEQLLEKRAQEQAQLDEEWKQKAGELPTQDTRSGPPVEGTGLDG